MLSVVCSQKRRFSGMFACQYVLVAGGGGGGYWRDAQIGVAGSGGGGAGGVLVGEIYSEITNGATRSLAVTVGNGGSGGDFLSARAGGNSIFDTAIATGGGCPGYSASGGSGAGGALIYPPGEGYASQGRRGGYASGGGGGGGGYSSEGVNDSDGSHGGSGVDLSTLMSDLTGYVAGGGGGYNGYGTGGGLGGIGGGGKGSYQYGENGISNTGGGGGGAEYSPAGSGGSGVIYIKYPNTFTYTYTGLSLTSLGTFDMFNIVKISSTSAGANIIFQN